MEYISGNIAFVGNYLPRRCGIATFTTDLCESITSEIDPSHEVFAIAITNTPERYAYPSRVKFEIRQSYLQDYSRAADFLNFSQVNILSLQHEYGIFGGEAGSYILSLLGEARMPVVTTFHTVLENLSEAQEEVFQRIVQLSDRLVVMSEKAIEILKKFKVPEKQIAYIPHGIPDFPFVDPNYYKDKFELLGRKVVLTFGLINPGKGIEYMIEALPEVVKKHPEVVYIVLGVTHPEVVRHSGEEYRLSLQRRVEKLGLEEYVIFQNHFVDVEELWEFLCAADIYVTPYLNKEHIVSGTLAYAMGAGNAIISTPYWYAGDVLKDGRGIIVPFRDSQALSQAISNLLSQEVALHTCKIKAYQYSRQMIWKNVARNYLNLFREVLENRSQLRITRRPASKAIISSKGIPEPKLDHLIDLTDHFGLLQHARYNIPDFSHGYTLDDNARALVVITKYFHLYQDENALKLLNRYLAFAVFCQKVDGTFHNFVSIERKFLDEKGSDDAHGRAIWGLGYIVGNAPSSYHTMAKECFEKATVILPHLNLRGAACAILGLHYYLSRYGGAREMSSWLEQLSQRVYDHFHNQSNLNWPWYEPVLTYDNAIIPHAMWLAWRHLKNDEFKKIAEETTKFLFKITLRHGHVSLVGNNGWHSQDKNEKAQFDQQPIDACGLIELAKVAYRLTGEEFYLKEMRLAFDWFMGINDLGIQLYDFTSGGCFDGLTPGGANLNQGAESTLSFLLSLLTLTEITSEKEEKSISKNKGNG